LPHGYGHERCLAVTLDTADAARIPWANNRLSWLIIFRNG